MNLRCAFWCALAGLIAAASGSVNAAQAQEPVDPLRLTTKGPGLGLTIPTWAEPAPKRCGVFTIVPPDTRGQLVQVSVPVGDLVMRATRALGNIQSRRAERKAQAKVQQALKDFQAQQPMP